MGTEYSSYTEFYLNELFPSAIMFGMSSKEFWEDEPQLYWSYRTFYLKKLQLEAENSNYICWLQGNYNCIAVSVALNNAFSKQKAEYPKSPIGTEKKMPKTELSKKLEKIKDNDIRQQVEYNYWARL